MTNTERLNAYVASLLVWNVKLHNLHWNVTGKLFKPLHEYTEALYDKAFEACDEVAELLKMKGEMPHATLRGSVELSVVEEVAPCLFSSCEVVAEVEADMKKMAKLAREIRDAAAEEDDFQTQGLFEGYLAGYAKELWFLSAMRADARQEGCCPAKA